MPITINGSGSITGISAGGLPDGTVTPADLSQPLTLGTVQASTSGTSIDFTGIPSWAKRITVMFNEVSTSGTSPLLVQLGAGSIQTSSYVSTGNIYSNANATAGSSSTAGMLIYIASNADIISGHLMLTLLGSNSWVSSHVSKRTTSGVGSGAGSTTLSGTLDRVRITTVNGTDTFDAGSINIMYE